MVGARMGHRCEGMAGRRMPARASILAGAIGVLAVVALAVALPVGAPASAVRLTPPPKICEPAGPSVCDHLLEILTVTPGGGNQTTATDFRPDHAYRFVFDGSVHATDKFDPHDVYFDTYYCYGGTDCRMPHLCGTCLLDVSGGGLGRTEPANELGTAAKSPPYSSAHEYSLPYLVDHRSSVPPQLSGRLTFSFQGASASQNYSGSYTIKIYDPSPCTVRYRAVPSLGSGHLSAFWTFFVGGLPDHAARDVIGVASAGRGNGKFTTRRVKGLHGTGVDGLAGGAVCFEEERIGADYRVMFSIDPRGYTTASERQSTLNVRPHGEAHLVMPFRGAESDDPHCPVGEEGLLAVGERVRLTDVVGRHDVVALLPYTTGFCGIRFQDSGGTHVIVSIKTNRVS